jgi:hypothetical protein
MMANIIGADVSIGGAGRNRFVFLAWKQSLGEEGIEDLEGAGATIGDRVDLGAMAADLVAAGDQAFVLDGTFGRGHLEWSIHPTTGCSRGTPTTTRTSSSRCGSKTAACSPAPTRPTTSSSGPRLAQPNPNRATDAPRRRVRCP